MDIASLSSSPSSGSLQSERVTGNTPAPTVKAATPIESTNPVVSIRPAVQLANKEQLSKALESINKTIQAVGQNIEFSVDDDSKQVIIKVIDQQTKQVLRQIPNEEVLEIAKSLDKLQGLLIKQTA